MSSAGSLSVGDAQPNQSAVFEEHELKAYARRDQPTEAGVDGSRYLMVRCQGV
jgi:hypothetical protein